MTGCVKCCAAASVLVALMGVARGAEYVVAQQNPAADDRNAGTDEKPFKTINAAIQKLQAGDSLIIRAGMYREQIELHQSGTAEQPIVIQAAKGEEVVINGADIAKDWKKVADDRKKRPLWKKTPWPAWKEYTLTGTDGVRSGAGAEAPRGPGGQLIVDHVILPQVADASQLFAGSYCYDPSDEGSIILWMPPPKNAPPRAEAGQSWWDNPVTTASADPNQHVVEASVRRAGVQAENVSYVSLRGLVCRYDTGGAQEAGLVVRGNHNLIENCVSEYMHGEGLHIGGNHITVRGCYTRYNGGIGLGGSPLANSLIEDCVVDGNTTMGHSAGWEAGGSKLFWALNVTVRHCQFINNYGVGLWFDTCHNGNIVERNFCSFNTLNGIMMEISPHYVASAPDQILPSPRIKSVVGDTPSPAFDPNALNIVRNNICVRNGWEGEGAGILLQLASKTVVVNNTVLDNQQYGIFLRYHPYDEDGNRCVDDVVLNNLVANSREGQIVISDPPVKNPGYMAHNRSDYNLLFMQDALLKRNPVTLLPGFRGGKDTAQYGRWAKTQCGQTYSLEEWTTIYGYDEHSIQADPKMVSPSTLDYRLQFCSPAIGAGVPNDYVQDDFFGRARPKNRGYSIGAVEFVDDMPAPGGLVCPAR